MLTFFDLLIKKVFFSLFCFFNNLIKMAAKTFAATTEKKRKQYLKNFEDNRPCNIFKLDNDFLQTTSIWANYPWKWSYDYFYLVLVEINPQNLLERLNCWATNATFGLVTFRVDPITIISGSLYQQPFDQSGEQNVGAKWFRHKVWISAQLLQKLFVGLLYLAMQSWGVSS